MAENEYLDSSKAARWPSVVQAIRNGGSMEEVVESVEDLIERRGSTKVYVELYRKYRLEWLAFVAKAKLNGCQWANLIDLPRKAA